MKATLLVLVALGIVAIAPGPPVGTSAALASDPTAAPAAQGASGAPGPRGGPLTALSPTPAPGASDPARAPLVLRVYFRDRAERDRLASELDATSVSTRGGYLTVWGSRATQERLLGRGLRVEIDEAGTRQAYARLAPDTAPPPVGAPRTYYGGYRTVEEVYALLDNLAATYPLLAEKVVIGQSWCKVNVGRCTQPAPYNGYDLIALRISNRAVAGPKPVFWFDAAMHAREIATTEVALRFANWLLGEYNTSPDARWLVDWHDLWVLPIANPDGRHVVEAGMTEPFPQRKNADNLNGCLAYPPTDESQFGTDLNRNFPFKWGAVPDGSSGVPCEATYRGPAVASEVETQAYMARLRALIPAQRGAGDTDAAPLTTTGAVMSLHSYSDLNLYPWSSLDTPAPNDADLANIAAHLGARTVGGNGYEACRAPVCLYPVDGAAFDWVYAALGAPAFSTELEGDTFFPPYPAIDSTIWPNNRGMLTYLAKIARTPYLLTRGPDAQAVAVVPGGVPRGASSRLTATMNYAWEGNAYRQNVAAAEYYVDTPPWAGGTPLPMAAADSRFDSPTKAVFADIATGGLAPGRHVVFVRGRGVNSYQGFPSWGPISAVFLDVTSPTATATPTRTATITATATPTGTATITPTATPTPTPLPASLAVAQALAQVGRSPGPTGQTGRASTSANGDVATVSGGVFGTGRVAGRMDWLLSAQVPAGTPPGTVPVAVLSTTLGLEAVACTAVAPGLGTVACLGTTGGSALQGSTAIVVFGTTPVTGSVTGPGSRTPTPLPTSASPVSSLLLVPPLPPFLGPPPPPPGFPPVPPGTTIPPLLAPLLPPLPQALEPPVSPATPPAAAPPEEPTPPEAPGESAPTSAELSE